MSAGRLRITEIFFSLQGEGSRVGLPTTFVRLTGCPLRCAYCDTEYAFQGGAWMSLEQVLQAVALHPTRHLTVTGGEPLAQKDCLALLEALCDAGYEVSLETSGALDISQVDPRVARIMDLKAPASGEEGRNLWSNVAHLSPRDEVKMVLQDEADYLWARTTLEQYGLPHRCPILLSPVWGKLDAAQLADWILRDGLDARMQIQLHKFLWGEVSGR